MKVTENHLRSLALSVRAASKYGVETYAVKEARVRLDEAYQILNRGGAPRSYAEAVDLLSQALLEYDSKMGSRKRNPAPECVIVTRHPASVGFIRQVMPFMREAPVLSGNVGEDDVRGKIVAGNLPLWLACLTLEYWAVEFSGAPPRGAEYDAKEMLDAGARIRRYIVTWTGEEAVPLE